MRHLSYLAMLAGCLAATLPLERLVGTRVLAQGRRLALTLLVTAVPFVCWDLWAVAQDQWSFDDRQTVGVEIPGGLPLEEVAFFVVIPLAILLSFEAVVAVLRGTRRAKQERR